MTLEEYVIKRKREDGINEFDLEKRMENTRICVNYIFEYFNNYLDTHPADEKPLFMSRKLTSIEKYLVNTVQRCKTGLFLCILPMESTYISI